MTKWDLCQECKVNLISESQLMQYTLLVEYREKGISIE
jgi:hypothetical protein